MSRPEQTIAYRVYWQGKDLLGTAQIEMPQVQYMTETLSGSGLAGEIESPTIGLTQSMTCKMTFTSATKDVFDILTGRSSRCSSATAPCRSWTRAPASANPSRIGSISLAVRKI